MIKNYISYFISKISFLARITYRKPELASSNSNNNPELNIISTKMFKANSTMTEFICQNIETGCACVVGAYYCIYKVVKYFKGNSGGSSENSNIKPILNEDLKESNAFCLKDNVNGISLKAKLMNGNKLELFAKLSSQEK